MIGLRELECSERIITITSLIKESINFWKEDVRPDDDQHAELDKISDDINSCMLDADAIQVSAVVAGYAARKVVVQRNKCSDCKELAVSDDDIAEMENENNYLRKLSRGGLIVPTTDLRHHIAKSFAILDLCQHLA